ncbi:MAG TPA: Ig-like domain-containing protein [Fimbriimonas sp.]|nr:Ig-like domain-containing protein [Fimbriimonas sp.]
MKLRHSALAALLVLAAVASADQSQVKVSFWPSVAVADSHTTINVTAEVRDSSGHTVRDGTQVMFTSTIGTFQSSVVPTVSGTAHAVLLAPSSAGIASITVAPVDLNGNPTVIQYEFVGSKSELSSAKEYVEIIAPGYMQYAHDRRVIGAAAPNQGVSLRYKDIYLRADDLQYDINSYTVIARKAHLKMGKVSTNFDELNLTLNAHRGVGTTNFRASSPSNVTFAGGVFAFLAQKDDQTWIIAPPEERYGLVEFDRTGMKAFTGQGQAANFDLADISTSPSTVSARKAVVFPRKGIQFQSAELYVANAKLIKLPLFVVNFNSSTGSPLVTDDIVSVNDNQIGVNYPQYLILRPGLTSDLRFHMGDRYGRGLGSDRGAFLDYEINWDHGDDMEGGLTFGGIGRNDWELDAHQFWKLGDRTTTTAQFSLPAGNGIYGSGSIDHQFVGYSMSLNAAHSQTFTGFTSSSQSYGASLMTDSRRVGRLPFRYTIGTTATETVSNDELLGRRSQDGEGLTLNLQSDSIPIDRISNLTTSWQFSKLYGENVAKVLGVVGSVNISHRLSNNANLLTSYTFTEDGFNEAAIGRHMVTVQGNYHQGNFSASLLASKSLGIDRLNLYGDASYSLSKLWRLAYTYTSDQYLGEQFLDYNFAIGYRIGWREVGLTWSYSTKRFGIELLGAQF